MKLTKKSFIKKVLEEGVVKLDKDGDLFFTVQRLNKDNFSDMTPKLIEQLKDEGKYDKWISLIAFNNKAPYTIQSLPLFGDSKRYVTKFIMNSIEDAVTRDLSDRSMKLLKRANEYLEFNQ